MKQVKVDPRLAIVRVVAGFIFSYSPYGVCAIIGRVFKSAQTAF